MSKAEKKEYEEAVDKLELEEKMKAAEKTGKKEPEDQAEAEEKLEKEDKAEAEEKLTKEEQPKTSEKTEKAGKTDKAEKKKKKKRRKSRQKLRNRPHTILLHLHSRIRKHLRKSPSLKDPLHQTAPLPHRDLRVHKDRHQGPLRHRDLRVRQTSRIIRRLLRRRVKTREIKKILTTQTLKNKRVL